MSQPGGCIAIFDSGLGGLSVWREVAHLLPDEPLLYLADQVHMPYGVRPLAEIRHFAECITGFLISQGAGIIVIACNTISGVALHHLRSLFPGTLFVGMEPALKPAVQRTQSGQVGVIATPVTIQGELFSRLLEQYDGQAQVWAQACPGLAEAVEAGHLESEATLALLERYLRPLVAAGVDQLALGCSHYPFLRPLIERVVGPGVAVIDPAAAVARQTARLLARQQALPAVDQHTPYRFYTSGDVTTFQQVLGRLLPVDTVAGPQVCGGRWQADGLAFCFI